MELDAVLRVAAGLTDTEGAAGFAVAQVFAELPFAVHLKADKEENGGNRIDHGNSHPPSGTLSQRETGLGKDRQVGLKRGALRLPF